LRDWLPGERGAYGQPRSPVVSYAERCPCPRADDAIRDKSMLGLKLPDRSLGRTVETAARRNPKLGLNLLDELSGSASPQRGPVIGIRCRYDGQIWRGPAHDGGNLPAKFVHVESGIVFATVRQGVFLVPTTHDRVGPDLLQDRRYPMPIGIHLDLRPRVGFWSPHLASVLSLDPDEVGVATLDALPVSAARVVAATGGDDAVRAVAAKTELD